MLACLAVAGCENLPTSVPGPGPTGMADKTGRGIPSNWISNPVRFASGVRLASVAATPRRLLATTLSDGPGQILSFVESGTYEVFAPQFSAPAGASCLVEIAPGLGGFTQGDVFASCGGEIRRFTADGTSMALFTSLPDGGQVAGLCFDPVGVFGNGLLALSSGGDVYRLDGQGSVERVGSVGTGGRGPSIAPARFGHVGGQLLVAFPQASEVRALSPAGVVSVVVHWPGVSSVCGIPDEPRRFVHTPSTLFVATDVAQVFRFPAADLAPFGGGVLLTSELRPGSAVLVPDHDFFRVRAFSRFMGPERAAAFVRLPSVTPITIDIAPGTIEKTIVLGSTDVVQVAVLSSFDLAPAQLDETTLLLAGASPATRAGGGKTKLLDLNGDAVLDMLLQFRPNEMQLELGATDVTLEGATFSGERVRGSERVTVQLR